MSRRHYHGISRAAQIAFRRAVLTRAGYQCEGCGKRARLEADHIVPLDKGGAHHPDNGQALCRACHIAKTRREAGQAEGAIEWTEFATRSERERRKDLFGAGL